MRNSTVSICFSVRPLAFNALITLLDASVFFVCASTPVFAVVTILNRIFAVSGAVLFMAFPETVMTCWSWPGVGSRTVTAFLVVARIPAVTTRPNARIASKMFVFSMFLE